MSILKYFLFVFFICTVQAQINQFPYFQNFDSVAPPALPIGWLTTNNRTSAGDYTTTKSSPYSDSNAVISTNATISQSLISPLLDFSNKIVDSLKFFERRSGTHNSGLLIEASTNGGANFSIILSDTFKNPGTTSYILRKLKLASLLNNQSNVRIRWRVLGNGTGTTGTIRFDDVAISALYNIDAAVTQINYSPIFPVTGESVIVLATVKNVGLEPIQNIPVEFYEDKNHDSIPQPEELFASSYINQQLLQNDTTIITARIDSLTIGDKTILIKTNLPGDQNPGNDIKKSSLYVGIPPYSIIVNEIMYAPSNPEPEWIELYNCCTDSVNLKNWKISNRNTLSKYTIAAASTVLRPKEYCIVTKDASQFNAVHPDILSPILQASSLPTYLLNNTGDAVVLFDYRGMSMDSVYYSPTWGGSDGKSLERIESQINTNDSTNWGESRDSIGSTPGRQNYLTPLEYDLSIHQIYAINSSLVKITVRNSGHQPVQNFSISIYRDYNEDSIAQSSELLGIKMVNYTLSFKDTIQIDFDWNNPPSGKIFLIAQVDFPEDMRLSNNTFFRTINNSFSLNTIVINEIMYEPKNGDAEYIELFNTSQDNIDICDWRITDFADTTFSKKYDITQSPYILGKNEFLVLVFDSSIYNRFPYLMDSAYHVIVKSGLISLNNDGDDIILSDLTRHTIDSIHYFPSWHNQDVEDVSGRSIERINPNLPSNDKRNWSTSAYATGGTPGKQNSLYTTSMPTNATMSFSPNPFSPDGDGYEDVTILHYQLASSTALIRVRIYDAMGRLIRTLAENEPSGSHGDVIWDGFNDHHQRVRMGIYIVLLEALDSYGGYVQTIKGTVVVAAKL